MNDVRLERDLLWYAPAARLRVVAVHSICAAALWAVLIAFASSSECDGQTSAIDAGASAAALLQQGIEQAERGQLAEADVTLEKAQRLTPGDPEVLASLGKVKARVGEVGPAIALFRQVTRLRPRSAEAHMDLAVALADGHDLPEALVEISAAQKLSPDLAPVHLNHARILADLHRGADAEREFSQAALLAPSNPDCYFYWALLERESGDLPKQTTLLQKLVALQPGNDEAWVLLGNSFAYQSKQQEAIASWRKALAINPQSSQAVYKLARALRVTDPGAAKKLEDDFEALRDSAESLERIKGLGNEAYLAMQEKDWAKAIATFQRAIHLCDQCSVLGDLHKDLGLAYCHSGQLREGRAELEMAHRLNPKDPDIVRALTMLDQRPATP